MKNSKNVSVQVVDSDITDLFPDGLYEIKRMEPKSSRLKQICLFCLALCILGILGFGYLCPDKVILSSKWNSTNVSCYFFKVCALSTKETVLIEDNFGKPLARVSNRVGLSYDDMLNDVSFFDMDSHDVMVFLHMQKTGK